MNGKKGNITVIFPSPFFLVLEFIHFIIIFTSRRLGGCDAVFACRRRAAPGLRDDFLLDLEVRS